MGLTQACPSRSCDSISCARGSACTIYHNNYILDSEIFIGAVHFDRNHQKYFD